VRLRDGLYVNFPRHGAKNLRFACVAALIFIVVDGT
jgi:hypothetical protein